MLRFFDILGLIKTMKLSHLLLKKIKKIKLIVSDVDGVLTDGKIYLGGGSEELKSFCARDALPMEMAMRSGIKIIWFTGRKCGAVIRRSKEIDGDVKLLFKGDLYKQKINLLDVLCAEFKIKASEILYVGDDWNDLFIMRQVGVSVTPLDGSAENKNVADIVTKASGGDGVMAEVVEIVMRAKGTWPKFIKGYTSDFLF